MTSGESFSSLLERAAQQLEDLAQCAHEGPWEVINRPRTAQIRCAYGSRQDGDLVASDEWRRNAPWIAAMSPAIAAPLVNWLRDTADDLRVGPVQTAQEDYALEFARLILGEP